MAIYFDYVVTIDGNKAKMDKDIHLYKGNKNIDYYFTIKDAAFRFNKKENGDIIEKLSPSHAAVTILKPNGVQVGTGKAIVEDNKIKLTITEDIIDEDTEIGDHTIVFDLIDDEKNSIATLPPVEAQFHVYERKTEINSGQITESNIVNEAVVGYAKTTSEVEALDVVDREGNYIKTIWIAGDTITKEKLNKLEEGVYKNSTIKFDDINIDGNELSMKANGVTKKTVTLPNTGGSGGSVAWESITGKPATFTPSSHSHSKSDITDFPTIPTRASQLTNDANYVNTTQMNEAIANATGNIDASNITIADTASNFTATNVEGALQEVGSQIKEIVTSKIEPENDDIPKIFFYGDVSAMSKSTSVDLDFEYKSRTASYKGVANTKWQGSSSLSYNKKNYTIKLFTDNTKSSKLKLNLKGWGKQNKFCLKANYIDSLHVRNLAGARIAYDMIKSRSDFSSLPTELQEAPRCGVIDGFPIKVYINGELMGLYTWNIPKDKWCSNMDEDNVNHAFLMAEKNNNGGPANSLVLACEFRANATIFADTSTSQYPPYDWVVEGPGDDVSAAIRTSFNNLINCVKDTDDATFKSTIGNYLDLTSAFDYYCFAYFVCHYDGLGKNLGMATYDGVKWFCTLYDMDSIFGASINGAGFLQANTKCPEGYTETNSLLWQRIEKCFGEELYARYLELRKGALSLGNIFTHVEEIYDIIPDRTYAEDRAKWASLPSVNANTTARIRTYMINRSTYVDSEMRTLVGPRVACTGITLNSSTLTFTSADTQTLTATVTPYNCTDTIIWVSSSDSIATVLGGVVTPKSNGTCTITATCGSQTATCAVTVSGMSESGGENDAIRYMTYGKGESGAAHLIVDNPSCWATINPVTVENGAAYRIEMDATWAWVHSYSETDDRWISQLVSGDAKNPQVYTFTANSTKIRYGCYDVNMKLTYCKLTKISGGSTGGPGGGSDGSDDREGVNLLDGVNLVNYYINSGSGAVQNAGVTPNTGAIKEFINVVGGNSYIFTADLNSTAVQEFRYAWYDSQGSFISHSNINSTNPPYILTAPSNAASMRFHIAVKPNTSYTAVTNLSLKVKKD